MKPLYICSPRPCSLKKVSQNQRWILCRNGECIYDESASQALYAASPFSISVSGANKIFRLALQQYRGRSRAPLTPSTLYPFIHPNEVNLRPCDSGWVVSGWSQGSSIPFVLRIVSIVNESTTVYGSFQHHLNIFA